MLSEKVLAALPAVMAVRSEAAAAAAAGGVGPSEEDAYALTFLLPGLLQVRAAGRRREWVIEMITGTHALACPALRSKPSDLRYLPYQDLALAPSPGPACLLCLDVRPPEQCTHVIMATPMSTQVTVNSRFAASHTLSLRYIFLVLFNTGHG